MVINNYNLGLARKRITKVYTNRTFHNKIRVRQEYNRNTGIQFFSSTNMLHDLKFK